MAPRGDSDEKLAKGESRWSRWQKVLSILVTLATLGGSAFAVERYFAPRSELLALEKRFDIKVLEDKLYYTQKRIWALEDRQAAEPSPQMKDEIRELKHALELLKKKYDAANKALGGEGG